MAELFCDSMVEIVYRKMANTDDFAAIVPQIPHHIAVGQGAQQRALALDPREWIAAAVPEIDQVPSTPTDLFVEMLVRDLVNGNGDLPTALFRQSLNKLGPESVKFQRWCKWLRGKMPLW